MKCHYVRLLRRAHLCRNSSSWRRCPRK